MTYSDQSIPFVPFHAFLKFLPKFLEKQNGTSFPNETFVQQYYTNKKFDKKKPKFYDWIDTNFTIQNDILCYVF